MTLMFLRRIACITYSQHVSIFAFEAHDARRLCFEVDGSPLLKEKFGKPLLGNQFVCLSFMEQLKGIFLEIPIFFLRGGGVIQFLNVVFSYHQGW